MTPAGAAGSISVGVYDEPELVVSGIGAMLARQRSRAAVTAVARGTDRPGLDVLLCDPSGRAVHQEQYLHELTTLTGAPLLVFTWVTSPAGVRRALAAGARGVVSKTADSAVLAAAVLAVHLGHEVDPLAARIPLPVDDSVPLSAREAEVLELICRGLSNLEIADLLFVSVNSIKTYVRQIYQKIDVSRRAQAVAWGLSHGY